MNSMWPRAPSRCPSSTASLALARSCKDARGSSTVLIAVDSTAWTPPHIEEVVPGSPAAKAGLRPDDLIVYVDGEQVLTVSAFKEILAKTRPGAVVKLEIRRVDKNDAGGGDRLIPVDLKLGDQPVK